MAQRRSHNAVARAAQQLPSEGEISRQVLLSLDLVREPESVSKGRKAVVTLLDRDHLSQFTDDARLLTSELISNAVQHGTGREITLTVERADRELYITVGCASENVPVLKEASALAESGRGMRLVDQVAAKWGTETDECGTRSTWFMLLNSRAGAR